MLPARLLLRLLGKEVAAAAETLEINVASADFYTCNKQQLLKLVTKDKGYNLSI